MASGSVNPFDAVVSPHVKSDGPLIRKLRKAKRLTQLQLAALADVSERTVRHAEKEKPIRISSLEAIALALSCPYNDLLRDEQHARAVESEQRRTSQLLGALRSLAIEESAKPFLDISHKDFAIQVHAPPELPFAGLFVGESGVRRWDDLARECVFHEPVSVLFDEIKAGGDLVVVRGREIRSNLTGPGTVFGHFNYMIEYKEDRIRRIDVSGDLAWHLEYHRNFRNGS